MEVRKVQLEFCYESKSFAPSDDILTLQSYELFSRKANISPTFFTFCLFCPIEGTMDGEGITQVRVRCQVAAELEGAHAEDGRIGLQRLGK